jgi:hypothetical protein
VNDAQEMAAGRAKSLPAPPGRKFRRAQNLPDKFAAHVADGSPKIRKISALDFCGPLARAGMALAGPWLEQKAPGRQNGSQNT